MSWVANGTGQRELTIRKNGATILAEIQSVGGAGNATEQVVMGIAQFAAGDYIELLVQQTSGGNLDAQAVAPYASTMSMVFQGT